MSKKKKTLLATKRRIERQQQSKQKQLVITEETSSSTSSTTAEPEPPSNFIDQEWEDERFYDDSSIYESVYKAITGRIESVEPQPIPHVEFDEIFPCLDDEHFHIHVPRQTPPHVRDEMIVLTSKYLEQFWIDYWNGAIAGEATESKKLVTMLSTILRKLIKLSCRSERSSAQHRNVSGIEQMSSSTLKSLLYSLMPMQAYIDYNEDANYIQTNNLFGDAFSLVKDVIGSAKYPECKRVLQIRPAKMIVALLSLARSYIDVMADFGGPTECTAAGILSKCVFYNLVMELHGVNDYRLLLWMVNRIFLPCFVPLINLETLFFIDGRYVEGRKFLTFEIFKLFNMLLQGICHQFGREPVKNFLVEMNSQTKNCNWLIYCLDFKYPEQQILGQPESEGYLDNEEEDEPEYTDDDYDDEGDDDDVDEDDDDDECAIEPLNNSPKKESSTFATKPKQQRQPLSVSTKQKQTRDACTQAPISESGFKHINDLLNEPKAFETLSEKLFTEKLANKLSLNSSNLYRSGTAAAMLNSLVTDPARFEQLIGTPEQFRAQDREKLWSMFKKLGFDKSNKS
ncbi:hypothetical protein RDWZM_003601 [Blomia tropicalis]|uniref:Uncharacterized protein n=1 Tax=Blomia tropicalis TaxID=40697 RepID=A0A9Q0RT69_BLOTA|nr:hypothetical protein RDWZM_003601 [Blomia tropicalis]